MRHILSIIICLIILIGTIILFAVDTEDLVMGYTQIVQVLGKSQLTSNEHLIGSRYERKDDYAGGYMCLADSVTGRDIPYGGCSTKNRKLMLTGKINRQHGNVNIHIRYGSECEDIQFDGKGYIEKELSFCGGGNYIVIEYENFVGEVDIKTEYIK